MAAEALPPIRHLSLTIDPKRNFLTEGPEGHHFDKVSFCVIFLDIEKVSLSDFLKDHESELDESSKSVGGRPWWGGSLENAHAYLAGRNVRAFEINSSYGFSGWVLATEVRRLA